ncbi:hypothetical protein SLS64_000556 [Diaporthe eres]|uniref:DUF7918 domain-containing protein n=1 Tax=Diaporthe eres TaxID=83184 RepID=A0ABR1PM44_DIAER
MAILEDLGLEVNIVVNDSPLQEYEDKGADLSDDGFVNDDDAERVSKDKQTARLLGLIRVRVWRTRIINTCVPENLRQTTKFDEMQKALAQKAVKDNALSHRAT